MLKATTNGEFIVKRWLVFLTLIVTFVSFVINVALGVSINPIKSRLTKNEKIDEKRNEQLHELDKDVAILKEQYERIERWMSSIDKKLDNLK